MLPIRPETDPIVEILRLAYRRGLSILRERASMVVQETHQATSTGGEETSSDTIDFPTDEKPGGTS